MVANEPRERRIDVIPNSQSVIQSGNFILALMKVFDYDSTGQSRPFAGKLNRKRQVTARSVDFDRTWVALMGSPNSSGRRESDVVRNGRRNGGQGRDLET